VLPSPCSASFPAGTQVTLASTTVAQFRHGFSGWGGPCSGFDDCSFVASSNVTVTAAFDRANVAFVTSSVTNGNLGGREGGDAICNQLAAAASLDGQYLAWLSTSTGSAIDRLRGSAAGFEPMACLSSTRSTILPDGMFYPLRIDQLGRDVGELSVLTATSGNGILGPPFSPPCADFTNLSTAVVDGGRTTAVGLLWSTFSQANCTVQRPIYCFGVGREVALRPEPDVGRVAFISTAFVPAGGRTGVDQICQTDANRLGLSGSFKAVLTTSTASAASQFDLTGPPWSGLDGTRIASTAQAFFAAAQWDTVPKAEFPYGNSGTWVGGTSLTVPGTAANTCNNWTSTTGNVDAGASGLTTVQQFFYGYGQNPCSSSMSVVCLQQ
jgi:hypothetical protein